MMSVIQLVTAVFEGEISEEEVPYLRGNMIRLSGDDPLFHNHQGEGFYYTYPLVQYKRINGCAALVGINQGAEALMRLLGKEGDYLFQLGKRTANLGKVILRSESFSLACDGGEPSYMYFLKRWLPLNEKNYRIFQRTENLSERITMLERILVGNILSFAKGVGSFFESPVVCRLSQMNSSKWTMYKDVDLMTFTVEFRCNVRLPDYVGLGKSVSMGHGVVKMKR